MDDASLFDEAQRVAESKAAPLAVRMRPRHLDEVVGQQHLLGPGTPLRRLIEGDANLSLLLWGPPGTGKTTLAMLVATTTGRRFVEMSAVTSGVKDVRAAIETAREQLSLYNRQTVLFIDEVHRFSKTQQDALLPGVERGTVSLVGATTENPYFSVVSPLLSRSLLLRLEPLADDDIREVVRRGLDDDRGFAGTVRMDTAAETHLVRMAGGDARRALTALEAAAGTAQAKGLETIDLATLEEAVDRAAVRYDRQGDQHYDVISAFIKSMRGSDVDAALHYLARMFEAGEEGRFIARRIMIFASEDVGMADPTALRVAVAAAQAFEMIGFPEAQLNLAQAVIHCSLAPKSNAVTMAIGAAQGDVRAGRLGTVPPHLRDSHYAGAAKIDHGKGYRYPHDFPGGVVAQQYAPDEVSGRVYYRPTDHATERSVGERLAEVRKVLHPDGGPTTLAPADPPRPQPDQPDPAKE